MTTQAFSHPYVGMWVTADGRIRHQLLPNGRYDEARGSRESAYQGRYEVSGHHIGRDRYIFLSDATKCRIASLVVVVGGNVSRACSF